MTNSTPVPLSDNLKILPRNSSNESFKILQSYSDNEHGLVCWDATLVAIKYLELLVEHVPETFEKKNVLELGAGTGAISIALARFCRDAGVETGQIVTTDKLVCVPLMEENIAINLGADQNNTTQQRVRARELLWEREDQYPQNVQEDNMQSIDILIVCDCVYENIEIWKTLLRAAWRLMNNDTMLLLVQESRGVKDALFFSVVDNLFDVVQVPREQHDTEYSSDDIHIFWMKKKDNADELDLESFLPIEKEAARLKRKGLNDENPSETTPTTT